MKKATKQKLVVLVIGIMFLSSSIAFIVNSAFTQPQQQIQQPLTSFVIDGDIDPAVENIYVQNGFTFLKYYYNSQDINTTIFIESLPQATTTNDNQIQLYVVKIPAEKEQIQISNFYGSEYLENITRDGIRKALCEKLVSTPAECGLFALRNSTS